MVTDQQVLLLRRRIMEGKTQQASAAAAGMSARGARRWRRGPLPSEKKKRSWRTRPDAFSEVWDEEIVPLLRRDAREKLQATVLLEWLDERYPGRFNASHLRTLQRRIRDWRALSGPEREVYFEQKHPPGREAQMDFTHCDSFEVTIGGEPFPHMVFEFILSHSGWRYAQICFSETFVALVSGLQGALWELGAAPEVVRSDNLGAATHELKDSKGRDFNERYKGHTRPLRPEGYQDQLVQCARERSCRAGTPQIEGRRRAGVDSQGQFGLRVRGATHKLKDSKGREVTRSTPEVRQEHRGQAQQAGQGEAGG